MTGVGETPPDSYDAFTGYAGGLAAQEYLLALESALDGATDRSHHIDL